MDDKLEKEMEVRFKINTLKAELEIIYATELLEYHDKNTLSGDNKTRCESRLKQLQNIMELISEIDKDLKKYEPIDSDNNKLSGDIRYFNKSLYTKKKSDYNKFRGEIEKIINKNSMENESDTPDFILAEYLTNCLINFDEIVKKRDNWCE